MLQQDHTGSVLRGDHNHIAAARNLVRLLTRRDAPAGFAWIWLIASNACLHGHRPRRLLSSKVGMTSFGRAIAVLRCPARNVLTSIVFRSPPPRLPAR